MATQSIFMTSAGSGVPVQQDLAPVGGYCGLNLVIDKKRNEVSLESVLAWQAMHGTSFRCPAIAQFDGANELIQVGSWKIQTRCEIGAWIVLAITTNLPKRGRPTYRNYVLVRSSLIYQHDPREVAEQLLASIRDEGNLPFNRPAFLV